MSERDSLGDRMKGYEVTGRQQLVRRMPVIIRVDGKAFHTLTRGMHRPHDDRFTSCMWAAALALCEAVQGAQVGYVQSDEISLLLVDYQTLDTQGWFDGRLDKMVSVSASIATAAFNDALRIHVPGLGPGLFDSRAFNLPREEVTNYFVWRQQDATRNSIEAAGQAHFSHRELHGVNCDQIQEKLHQERGINWNDAPTKHKRGACAVRETFMVGEAQRHRWIIDEEIPIFTRDRKYIERFVNPDADVPTMRRAVSNHDIAQADKHLAELRGERP